MKSNFSWLAKLAVVSSLWIATEARATQLTFDVYTNSAKGVTHHAPNSTVVPPSYGDNVSDFDPGALFEGQYYYRYGSDGGFTPHVTVEYRFWNNPGDNGGPNGRIWDTGYGDLQYVAYPSVNQSFVEMRFAADFGYRVTLSNFNIAAFGASLGGQTVKVVRDAGLPSATTLWSAGPDGGVTVTGGGSHDTYMPNILVADGHTVSLIYGQSGNIGVDNVVIVESIPEPTAGVLLGAGALLLGRLREARNG